MTLQEHLTNKHGGQTYCYDYQENKNLNDENVLKNGHMIWLTNEIAI